MSTPSTSSASTVGSSQRAVRFTAGSLLASSAGPAQPGQLSQARSAWPAPARRLGRAAQQGSPAGRSGGLARGGRDQRPGAEGFVAGLLLQAAANQVDLAGGPARAGEVRQRRHQSPHIGGRPAPPAGPVRPVPPAP